MYSCTAWSFVRWLGMVCTMLLAITWLTSNWWSVSIQTASGAWARLADGRIAVGPAAPGASKGDTDFGVTRRSDSDRMRWGFEWTGEGASRSTAVPIWAAMAATAVIAVGFRRRQQAMVYR